MSIAFTPPASGGFSRELFYQMYLSSSHLDEDALGVGLLSVALAADYFIGFMRLPFLYIEVKRIQKLVADGKTFKNSVELRYQVLSTFANALEIFLWFYEKKFVEINKRRAKKLQGFALFMRVVLYEQAVRKETEAFIQCQRVKKLDPSIVKNKDYKFLKVSLISHTAFLGWATLWLITHLKGIPYPRPYMKMLRFTSFSFGLISMGYDDDSLVNQYIKAISKKIPNGQIYR